VHGGAGRKAGGSGSVTERALLKPKPIVLPEAGRHGRTAADAARIERVMEKRARLSRRWRRSCGVPLASVQSAMQLLATCVRARVEGDEQTPQEHGDEDLEEMHWRKTESVRVDDTAVSTMH